MRKNNWIVAAIAAVACGVLLWAWFALGFNHVDDPLDLVVAIVWWLVVAAVVGGIVWAEGKRREKMRLAFVGEGVVYNPEAGLVMPDAGESELAALERTLSGMAFPDEVAVLDERVRPAFRWVVRSRKFDRNGEVWEGEVVAVHDPDAEPRPFSSREDLALLLCLIPPGRRAVVTARDFCVPLGAALLSTPSCPCGRQLRHGACLLADRACDCRG